MNECRCGVYRFQGIKVEGVTSRPEILGAFKRPSLKNLLQESCARRSASGRDRLPHFDRLRARPMGSRLTPRGHPFKMSPLAARAPADGWLPVRGESIGTRGAGGPRAGRSRQAHVKWRSHGEWTRRSAASGASRGEGRTVWSVRERLSEATQLSQREVRRKGRNGDGKVSQFNGV